MTRKTFALIACCMLSPAIVAAQTGGLTHVQLLALQQQLKEECGLAHATGRMDGPTRHAIAVCNKKYGTQGNGAALLAAMNIGFNSGDNAPQGGMGTVMGNDNGMSMGTSTGMSMGNDNGMGMSGTRRSRRVSHARNDELTAARTGPCAGLRPVDRDAAAHPVDSTSGGVDVDATTNDRAVATARAHAGDGSGDNCTTNKIRKSVKKDKK